MLPCNRETEMSVIQRGYLLSMPPSLQSLEKINITPIRAVGRAAEPADPGLQSCIPLTQGSLEVLPVRESGRRAQQALWVRESPSRAPGPSSWKLVSQCFNAVGSLQAFSDFLVWSGSEALPCAERAQET